MLKILQARLQQYVNCELPEVQHLEGWETRVHPWQTHVDAWQNQ